MRSFLLMMRRRRRPLVALLISSSCLGLAHAAKLGPASIRRETASAKTAEPVAGIEDVKSCLERMRRADLDKEQSRAQGATDSGQKVIYGYHLIPPSDLPRTCVAGDLKKFKSALRRQVEGCERAPESVASAAIDADCAAIVSAPRPVWCERATARKRELRRRQVAMAANVNANQPFSFGCRSASRKVWCTETGRQLLKLAESSPNFATFMEKARVNLSWYRSDGRPDDDADGKFKKGDVQFTAYYAPPAIEASLKPHGAFRFPLYRRPPNLVQMSTTSGSCGNDPMSGKPIAWCLKEPDGHFSLVPDRAAIDGDHALKNEKLVIAYVRDPVDIAFLMVQGSGSIRIATPEGVRVVRVGYDGQNGRPRYMLGRIVRCDGGEKDDYSSESGIRNYLAQHSDRASALMTLDQSYVFFRTDRDQVIGSGGVPLTGGYALATDTNVIPTGAATLFTTARPEGPAGDCENLVSMAVAEDTGGAIRGAHVDWYMGEGAAAKARAGAVNTPGAVFVALPKDSSDSCAPAAVSK